MSREDIHARLVTVLRDRFEITDPGLNDDLREKHGFDSIDAVQLLAVIEGAFGIRLTHEDKKRALELRTLSDVCDYVEGLQGSRRAQG